MPYVTSIERLAEEKGWKQGREEGREEGRERGREEGRERGREEGLERGLKRGIRAVLGSRLGQAGLDLMPEIEALHGAELLETILDQASSASTPEQLRNCWQQP